MTRRSLRPTVISSLFALAMLLSLASPVYAAPTLCTVTATSPGGYSVTFTVGSDTAADALVAILTAAGFTITGNTCP